MARLLLTAFSLKPSSSIGKFLCVSNLRHQWKCRLSSSAEERNAALW